MFLLCVELDARRNRITCSFGLGQHLLSTEQGKGRWDGLGPMKVLHAA